MDPLEKETQLTKDDRLGQLHYKGYWALVRSQYMIIGGLKRLQVKIGGDEDVPIPSMEQPPFISLNAFIQELESRVESFMESVEAHFDAIDKSLFLAPADEDEQIAAKESIRKTLGA